VPIAVTEDHEALRVATQRWAQTHCPPSVPRGVVEADAGDGAADDGVPAVWEKMAAQGWLGLHLPEGEGGQGFTLAELAVVVEELGASLLPGPLLPTLLVSAALARHPDAAVRGRLLPGLADGSVTAALALGARPLASAPSGADGGNGAITVSGVVRPVLGAGGARLVLVPVQAHGGSGDARGRWLLLDREAASGGGLPVTQPLRGIDGTRVVGSLDLSDGLEIAAADQVWVTADEVHGLSLVLNAAESAGIARWCLETASDYAKVRVQFGRPIGQFQAVKHALADMLVSVEQCAAVAWDAAAVWSEDAPPAERRLSASIAGAVALDAAAHCAKQCIQILGGIGFTWEHDAHFYLKRAMANLQLLAGGDVGALDDEVAALAVAGARRNLASDLPDEAEALREEIRTVVAQVAATPAEQQRAAIAEAGLIMPHWPAPWGRGASPLEQLVIDEELAAAGVARPHLAVGAWALPTLIAHGTPEQQEHWVRPTLLGQLNWCQLFSEPGAGSDLAALSTKATRVEGGYVLNGQKVWTSLAQVADFGICLARTDPEAAKHAGITYFIVDMHAEGIDIRPLRELTGAAMFNEVFFNDVFVPDDAVVGLPGDGWRIGRTTLANERVSMSSGASFGNGVESLIRTVAHRRERGEPFPASLETRLGNLIAEAQSVALLGHRSTLRTLSGVDPGSGSSVRKLLGVEHEQRVQEMGMALYGADGAVLDGKAQRWEDGFLSTRCLTIAGGTSEVQRNVIAERILGQPRDPEPGS
jgi:alkylation response protein AidB-like acyl-CoA dehydrogenase